jgi:hypothetical protein
MQMVKKRLSVIIVFSLSILPVVLFSACSPSKVEPAGTITKTPDEFVLMPADIPGEGWERREALPVPEHGAEYAYQVSYSRIRAKIPPNVGATTETGEDIVTCKAALYYNEAEAHSAYITLRSNYINGTGNEPPEPSSKIGDEALVDTRPVINGTGLIFRKANVIVWLSINRENWQDIETLASIIEERIVEGA